MRKQGTSDVHAERVALEASAWLTRLEKAHQPEVQSAFCAWLRTDPSHAQAFLEMTWLDCELRDFNGSKMPQARQLIEYLRECGSKERPQVVESLKRR